MTATYCSEANQLKFPFVLPELNFHKEKFGKYYSLETFDYHYNIHHLTYINNLNKFLNSDDEHIKEYKHKSLEEIVTYSNKKNIGIFNNAAQVWNHSFFWNSIIPDGGGNPNAEMEKFLVESFGNIEAFHNEFINAALTQFGSGWVWLVLKDQKLQIIKTSNAENPLSVDKDIFPILTCDVWEHAYYIDYRNKRNEFVKLFLEKMVNWEFALRQLKLFKS